MKRPSLPTAPATNGSTAASGDAPWGELMPEDQWQVFKAGVDAFEADGIGYLLHGALALATYTGHWRNTKDVDVVIRPADRERAIAALRGAGFEDYFDREGYDRSWIFRGIRDDVLFDVIWDLPNHRVAIDEEWFKRAQPLQLHGRSFSVVPAEELVRVKLYVLQRERCDWVDVLNVLAGAVGSIVWRWLVDRMGRDVALLQGALAVFNWLSPHRARTLPAWLRAQFALHDMQVDDLVAAEERRVRLFDSRPWFAAHQPLDRPLER
jgi:hypothetical protein